MTTACALIRSPGHVYPEHAEAPARFQYLGGWESKPYAAAIHFLDAQPAPRKAVTAVHSERMLRDFEAACRQGPGITDYAPTFVTPSTYTDAFLAAGATLDCTQAVLTGRAQNAFAIVRPPGHHAEPEASMGFCLLNNIAIAVRHALPEKHRDRWPEVHRDDMASGIGKALIVDFDVHHGNGTQAVFMDEQRVAFFSTQQENIYPFRTGLIEDAPQRRGSIVNLPLPSRAGDAAFARIAEEVLTPLVEHFAPEMMFVSAGFDSHWNDPLAELGLSSAGYYAYARRLVELAGKHCSGKIVFVLEGGYNPKNVASGVEAVLAALTGTEFSPQDPSPFPEPDISARLEEVRAWNALD
ncbi:MAG: histone deacetylase [Chloroflexi bacterium]|nr:MAG: histone deacetylase [Chloroflexota bacterium]